MPQIRFNVSAETVTEMERRAVYLDVFGVVRWTDTTDAVTTESGMTVRWYAFGN